MILRLTNSAVLQRVVERQMQELDLGFDAVAWLSNENNIALTDGKNIALFELCQSERWQRILKGTVFDAHTLFEARGRDALTVGTQMLQIMFDHYLASAIKGLTPAHKRAARWFNRKLGFKSCGVIDTVDGPQELFLLERSQWVS